MKTLFEKNLLGGIELQNRFVRSATHENMTFTGEVTKELIDLYTELAKEKVGLIVTSGMEITEDLAFKTSMHIFKDENIESLKTLANAIHEAGSKVMAQLVHGGSNVFWEVNYQAIGPSAVQDRFSQITPKEMTKNEIKDTVNLFRQAARRSKLAGFDGVQLQASFGFLLNKFLSPFYNRRLDEYGGSIENRARILVEIREAIADECGKEFPVFIKLSIDDLMKDDVKGLEFSESKEIIKILEDTGYDAIELTGGNVGEKLLTANFNDGKPFFKEQIIEISKEVKIPLIAHGGIRTKEVSEELISYENIDAVSFARPFIADTDLVSRWQEEKESRCTTCFQCIGPNGIRCIKNEA